MKKKDTNLLLLVGAGVAVFWLATKKDAAPPQLTEEQKAEIRRKYRSM